MKVREEKLRPIDVKWLDAYIKNGGNALKAAAEVKHYNIKDPKQYKAASKWGCLAYKRVKPSVQEEMEARGLGIGTMLDKLREGINAFNTVRDNFGNIRQRKNSQGDLVPDVEPDFSTRFRYMDAGLKLQGAYPYQRHEITGADGKPIEVKKAVVVHQQEMTGEEWERIFGSVIKQGDEAGS